MSVPEAIALGILQGLTEFFPVSSSGHLVLAESLLGVNPPGVAFEVLVHLATLCSVLVVYRRRLGSLLVGAWGRRAADLRYLSLLGVATVPAAVVGISLTGTISRVFDKPALAAGSIVLTGAVVYATRWLLKLARQPDPGWLGSLAVGLAQAVALLPGISRSGVTVATALRFRTDRDGAAEFSFLLSVPAICGAALLEIPAIFAGDFGVGLAPLAVAALGAFITGMLAILLFVRWLRSGSFYRFAYYCWAVGGAYMLYALANLAG
jgi:undecaprenyl-diphosphatase